MKFSRLLLIFPEYKHTQFGANHPPVGLGYLSEVLQINNIEHEVVDMRLGYNEAKLKSKIMFYQPDLIVISMMTLLHKITYQMMENIRNVFPKIRIVAGGPHVSTFREKVLQQCAAVDFGITQEGELTLLELCQGKSYEEIKGFIFRDDDRIVFTGQRPFIENLDELPFPKYEKFSLKEYLTDEIPILTSRGCPYSCIYCPVKTAIGRKYRVRNPQKIADEIEYWYEKGYRHFGVVDDNFLMNKTRVLNLCSEIKKRKLTDNEFRCPNGVRADQCDREILSSLKEVGFKYLAIGVEGGNDRVLASIKKGEKIEVIKKAISQATELGFEVILFFLVGSPGETWQDLENSVELALTYPVFDAKFYNLIPFPDTELFSWVTENKYFIRKPDDYLNDASHWDGSPVFSTPEMTLEERKKALLYTSKIRKIIRKKSIERKLTKFGILGKFLALIFVNEFIQYQLLHNRFMRKISTLVFRTMTNGRR